MTEEQTTEQDVTDEKRAKVRRLKLSEQVAVYKWLELQSRSQMSMQRPSRITRDFNESSDDDISTAQMKHVMDETGFKYYTPGSELDGPANADESIRILARAVMALANNAAVEFNKELQKELQLLANGGE